MNTKADPYANKLQKRINVLLFVLTVVIIALFVRASAHGGPLISFAPQPFWSTLSTFQVQPKASSVLLTYGIVTQHLPDYGSASHADPSLVRFADNSDFTPIDLLPAKVIALAAPPDFVLGPLSMFQLQSVSFSRRMPRVFR